MMRAHAQHARSQGPGPARSDARGRHGAGRADARAHRAAGERTRSSKDTIEHKQQLIERKDRDIAWRDAKLEKINFELARLKRWKFGAKTEAMDAEQRQLFQDTLPEDEAEPARRSWPRCRQPCPRHRPHPRRRRASRAARRCPNTCGASSTTTSPRTPPAPRPTAASR